MKYLARKNYRELVLTVQNVDADIDVSVISEPLHLITDNLELIIRSFNALIEQECKAVAMRDAKESIFQRISNLHVQALKMIIDDRITIDAFFQDQLARHPAGEVEKVRACFQRLHELFLQQGKCFDEVASSIVTEEDDRVRYLEIVKDTLATHIRQIVVILSWEQKMTYLRNPLYLQAVKDVRRLMPGLKQGAKRRRVAVISVEASAAAAVKDGNDDTAVVAAQLKP